VEPSGTTHRWSHAWYILSAIHLYTINVTYIKKALAGSGAREDAMHQQIGGCLISIYSDAVWFWAVWTIHSYIQIQAGNHLPGIIKTFFYLGRWNTPHGFEKWKTLISVILVVSCSHLFWDVINHQDYISNELATWESFFVQQFITRCSVAVCSRLSTTSSLQFSPQRTETLFPGRETLLESTEIKDKSR